MVRNPSRPRPLTPRLSSARRGAFGRIVRGFGLPGRASERGRRARPALRRHHPARGDGRPLGGPADRRSGLCRRCTAISPSPPRAIAPRCRSMDTGSAFTRRSPPSSGLYDAKQATIVHAVATGYRDRSHFDGQDVLESGYPRPGRHGQRLAQSRAQPPCPPAPRALHAALGVGAIAPLVIRGPAPALGWAPPGGVAPASGGSRPACARSLHPSRPGCSASGSARRSMAEKVAAEQRRTAGGEDASAWRPDRADAPRGGRRGDACSPTPDGPRIAALAFDGFDTHQNEGAAQGLSGPAPAGARRRLRRPRTPISATPGRRQSSSRSPNSAAPFGSTARTEPIMAPGRSR